MANMLLYLKERHPKVDRPLVDWNLLSVMEIPTVGGALLGSFLNKVSRMYLRSLMYRTSVSILCSMLQPLLVLTDIARSSHRSLPGAAADCHGLQDDQTRSENF